MRPARPWLPCAALAAALMLGSCSRPARIQPLSGADSARVTEENLKHRAMTADFFRDDPGSPFRRDSSIRFDGLRWFPVNPLFRVQSRLHRYENPETVNVQGTRGEIRRQLRYGHFTFTLPDPEGNAVTLRLNAYKFTPSDGQRFLLFPHHLSVWFTDLTTGKETYHVGRYVDVGEELPGDSLYTLDFNKAYNPYCAYSALYSCAVPREEDRLEIEVRAGEMIYGGSAH
ncbi:MAG: DUF1684 domain-containing protein [Bacteroidota bacterium]